MNNDIHVVDQDPLLCLPALVFIGHFPAFFFQICFNKICNGFQLGSIASLANYKKIGHGFGYFTEVEAYDLFTFFLLDGMNDCFEDLTVSR